MAGEVKESVRSGSTVVGCDSSGRERCTVLQGRNEDFRSSPKGHVRKNPPIFRGETLPKPSRTDEHIKVTPEVNDKLKVFKGKTKEYI